MTGTVKKNSSESARNGKMQMKKQLDDVFFM